MARRIRIIHRIIIAIAIQIQTVDGFGVQVGSIIGRDESVPFGRVVSGVAVVEASVVIVVVATVTDGVGVGNIVAGNLARDGAIALGIVQILGFHGVVGVTYILPIFPSTVKKKPPRPRCSMFIVFYSCRSQSIASRRLHYERA